MTLLDLWLSLVTRGIVTHLGLDRDVECSVATCNQYEVEATTELGLINSVMWSSWLFLSGLLLKLTTLFMLKDPIVFLVVINPLYIGHALLWLSLDCIWYLVAKKICKGLFCAVHGLGLRLLRFEGVGSSSLRRMGPCEPVCAQHNTLQNIIEIIHK